MITFPEVLQTIVELIRVKDQLEAENKQLKEFIQKMNSRREEENREEAETHTFEDAVKSYEKSRG